MQSPDSDSESDTPTLEIDSRPIVWIGIAGPTRSGKTTLALCLKTHLQARSVLHLDGFFRSDVDDVEVPEAINYDRLLRDMNEIESQWNRGLEPFSKRRELPTARIPDELVQGILKLNQRYRFLLVEGFLLFSDPRIAGKCPIRIWLEGSQAACRSRRLGALETQGPFVVDGETIDWKSEFDDNIWMAYLENRDKQIELMKTVNCLPLIFEDDVPSSPRGESFRFLELDGTINKQDVVTRTIHGLIEFLEDGCDLCD